MLGKRAEQESGKREVGGGKWGWSTLLQTETRKRREERGTWGWEMGNEVEGKRVPRARVAQVVQQTMFATSFAGAAPRRSAHIRFRGLARTAIASVQAINT